MYIIINPIPVQIFFLDKREINLDKNGSKRRRIVHSVHTTQLRKMEVHAIKHLVVLMLYILCRCSSPVSYDRDLVSSRGSYNDEWHADLLGCCSEPALCMSKLQKFDYYNLSTLFSIKFQ